MYNKGIINGLEKGYRNEVISRKIYITYPTFAFLGNSELEFELLNSISNEFKVPIASVQIAGSAKTGFSYYKNKPFQLGKSDLDVAIIDPHLFQKFCETVMHVTNGFQDLSKFRRIEDDNDYDSYKNYISKGFFRPDIMPTCEAKKKWSNFFNKLSVNYNTIFSDINAGIYFSQVFFEFKQSKNIDFFKKAML